MNDVLTSLIPSADFTVQGTIREVKFRVIYRGQTVKISV